LRCADTANSKREYGILVPWEDMASVAEKLVGGDVTAKHADGGFSATVPAEWRRDRELRVVVARHRD
jgi:hypothetical protein